MSSNLANSSLIPDPLKEKFKLELETATKKHKAELEKLHLQQIKHNIAKLKLNREYRALKAINREDITEIVQTLVQQAKKGDRKSQELILKFLENKDQQTMVAIQNTIQNNSEPKEEKQIIVRPDQVYDSPTLSENAEDKIT